MMLEHLTALGLFALVVSITPGPNNLMLMTSGANFGLRRSLPHLAGVWGGVCVMMLVLGLGVCGLLVALPGVLSVLRWVSVFYMLYLAWRIAAAEGIGTAGAAVAPLSILEAAAFQWINPKAWTMALGAITGYATSGHLLGDVAVITLVFAVVNAPCICIWAVFGIFLRQMLGTSVARRVFNIVMALLLVFSLYPVLKETTVSIRPAASSSASAQS